MTVIPVLPPSPHEDDAQAIRFELQRLVQNIRGFGLRTTTRRRRVALTGHVDPNYLRAMGLLLEAHPVLAATVGLTGAEIRDHLSFYSAHQGVGEELMLNGRKMIDTLNDERGSVAERALRAQKMARTFNFPEGNDDVIPQLAAIEREFERGRPKRAARKKLPGDLPTEREVKP